MKTRATALLALAAGLSRALPAQTNFNTDTLVVKTVALHHLSNNDAVALLTPYMMGRGNVFSAGNTIHAITLRSSAKTIGEMERLLAQYDRSPMTVTLSFQLVTADNSNRRDPAVAGLDSVLRSVLKFSGYRLSSTAVVSVSERQQATQNLSADGRDYRLSCQITDISGDGPDASVQLQVDLRRINTGMQGEPLVLSTGVTIPVGHTVVLGTSVAPHVPTAVRTTPQAGRAEPAPAASDALILVVRPQVATTRKD